MSNISTWTSKISLENLTIEQIKKMNDFADTIKKQDFFKNAQIHFPADQSVWSSMGNMAIVTMNNGNEEVKYFIKKQISPEAGNYVINQVFNKLGVKIPEIKIIATGNDAIPFLYISRDVHYSQKNGKTYKLEGETKELEGENNPNSNFVAANNQLANRIEIDHALRKFMLYLLFFVEDAKYGNNFYFEKNKQIKTIPFDINILYTHSFFSHEFLKERKINVTKENFWDYLSLENLSKEGNLLLREGLNPSEIMVRNMNLVSNTVKNYLYPKREKVEIDQEKKYIILTALQKVSFLTENLDKILNDLFKKDTFIQYLIQNQPNYLYDLSKEIIPTRAKQYRKQVQEIIHENKDNFSWEKVKQLWIDNFKTFNAQLKKETAQWNLEHPDRKIPDYQTKTNQKESIDIPTLPPFDLEKANGKLLSLPKMVENTQGKWIPQYQLPPTQIKI